MKQQLDFLLLSLGIHRTLLGTRYLRYAMKLAFENQDYLLCYTDLFQAIARHFHTNADNVNHCITTAIKKCWYNGNRELLEQIAGYPLEDLPPNSEFIDILFHYLERTYSQIDQ